MIEPIPGLPDGVVGVRASGEVTDDDYEDVLIPAVEAALADHDKIRLLYVLGADLEHVDAGAMWEDTKVGLGHLFSFERMAVVTDVTWIARAIRWMGFAIPAEVQVFPDAELDQATAWITEGLT